MALPANVISHTLKEIGHGSMENGIKIIADTARKSGRKEGVLIAGSILATVYGIKKLCTYISDRKKKNKTR